MCDPGGRPPPPGKHGGPDGPAFLALRPISQGGSPRAAPPTSLEACCRAFPPTRFGQRAPHRVTRCIFTGFGCGGKRRSISSRALRPKKSLSPKASTGPEPSDDHTCVDGCPGADPGTPILLKRLWTSGFRPEMAGPLTPGGRESKQMRDHCGDRRPAHPRRPKLGQLVTPKPDSPTSPVD